MPYPSTTRTLVSASSENTHCDLLFLGQTTSTSQIAGAIYSQIVFSCIIAPEMGVPPLNISVNSNWFVLLLIVHTIQRSTSLSMADQENCCVFPRSRLIFNIEIFFLRCYSYEIIWFENFPPSLGRSNRDLRQRHLRLEVAMCICLPAMKIS